MPYYYFDSTALVKRYSMERGTRVVNKLMVKRGKVAILPMWSVTDFYSAKGKLRKEGLLTRDPRKKERKKYGQKGARARFQFSKR